MLGEITHGQYVRNGAGEGTYRNFSADIIAKHREIYGISRATGHSQVQVHHANLFNSFGPK